jgi:MFS family permease
MVNLGMAIGRPIVGFYSDIVGGINMAAGATFFGSLVCYLVWMFANSYGVLILAAILGGSVCGTFWATIPPLTSNAVGMKELPSGLSIIWTSVVIPCLFAEPIALSLEGHSDTSNKSVQIFAGSMFLGGTISLLFLRGSKAERLRSEEGGSNSESSSDDKGGRVGCVFGRWAVNAFTWGKF